MRDGDQATVYLCGEHAHVTPQCECQEVLEVK